MFSQYSSASAHSFRDYINATDGFRELGHAMHKSPKSLMRMLGPKGNPQAENVFEILARLQSKEGIRFRVSKVAVARLKKPHAAHAPKAARIKTR